AAPSATECLLQPSQVWARRSENRQQVTSGHDAKAYFGRYVTISYLSWLTENEADRTEDISQASDCTL
ncbi:UNVERIFIED_CONTAM: hypothetical protein NY603_35470, partial [Bacteroidetes bacterium 56_B9]